MKRILLFLLTTWVFSLSAGAQVFNHLALGPGVGTDGVSLELAAPIGSRVILRAGYGAGLPFIGHTVQRVAIPEHPGNAASENVQVPLSLSLGMSDGRLLVSVYPFSRNHFHITAGLYMGSSRMLCGSLSDMPEDYDVVGLDVDGYLVKAHDGVLTASLCSPGIGTYDFSVRPYLGVGYGRPVREGSRISYSVDTGLQFLGKSGLYANGEGLTGRVKPVPISGDQLAALGSFDKYMKYAVLWPTISFHLYFRLF